MDQCVICNSSLDKENAAVLEMGAYGTPKYLCESCSADLDTATASTDPEEIAAAIAKIAKKVSEGNISERTFATIDSILGSATERAERIKAGTYDFEEDKAEDEDSFEEIPEELQETEEDKELDRKEAEQTEKVNKVLDYMSVGAVIGVAVFVIWKLIDTFLF